MNNKFDELAKGLAQSVTRRQAFKKLGGVLVGTFAGWLGLDRVSGASGKTKGVCAAQISLALAPGDYIYNGICVDPTTCQVGYSPACQGTTDKVSMACGGFLGNKGCSF